MATERSIKVRLTAEARSLKDELKASALAAKELKSEGKLTNAELKDLSGRADKAALSLLKLAADGKLSTEALKATDREVEELNKDLKDLGAKRGTGAKGTISSLQAEIATAKKRMEELRTEFKKTGSGESLAGFKAAEKEAQRLETLLGDVKHAAGMEGQSIGQRMAAGIKKGLQRDANGWQWFLTPQGLAVGAGLVTAATPIIATGIGSAVGAGLIAGAAMLHKDDPQIVQAVGVLKSTLTNELKTASAPLVPVMADALHQMAGLVKYEEPTLRQAFAALAPAVKPLTQAVESFVDPVVKALPRLATMMADVAADPRTINSFHDMGDAVGDVFNTIADNKEVVVTAFEAIGWAVQGVSKVFDGLLIASTGAEKGLAWFVRQVEGDKRIEQMPTSFADLSRAVSQTAMSLTNTGAPVSAAQKRMQELSKSVEQAVKDYGDYQKMLDGINGTHLDSVNATIAAKNALSDLRQSLKDNGRTMNLNTQAGRDNMSAVTAYAKAAEDAASATYNETGSVSAATAVYNSYKSQLVDTLVKSGMAKDKAKALADQLMQIPKNISTDVKVNVDMKAIAADVRRAVSIAKHILAGGLPFAGGGLAVPSAATGAIYPASNPPLLQFAEPQTHGEALIPRAGIPNSTGLALANVAAGWHGGHVVANDGAALQNVSLGPVSVVAQFGTETIQARVVNAQREEQWRSRRR